MGLSRSSIIGAAALSVACGSGTISGGDGSSNANNGSGASSSTTGGNGSNASGGSGSGSSVSGPGPCAPGIQAGSQIPRLTNAQYDRTVRDLLGVTGLKASGDAVPSSILATDQAGSLTSLGWSSYDSVAKMISAQVMADATLKAKFLSCATTDTACLHNTVL